MATNKSTSKWTLGGDGIKDFKIPAANREAVKQINREKKSGGKKPTTKK